MVRFTTLLLWATMLFTGWVNTQRCHMACGVEQPHLHCHDCHGTAETDDVAWVECDPNQRPTVVPACFSQTENDVVVPLVEWETTRTEDVRQPLPDAEPTLADVVLERADPTQGHILWCGGFGRGIACLDRSLLLRSCVLLL